MDGISCDEERGVLTIRDPRLFCADGAAFCRALVEQLAEPRGALRAELSLLSSELKTEFDPRRFSRGEIADRVATAIASASRIEAGQASKLEAGRDSLAVLFTFVAGGRASIWETRIDEKGRYVISNRLLTEAPWIAVTLARSLRRLPGLEGCRALPWSGRIVVDRTSGTPAPADLVRAAEAALEIQETCQNAIVGESSGDQSEESASEVDKTTSCRTADLLLAAGSFALAVMGLVLPGVPMMPFLLMSHHHLHRAAPQTAARLDCLPGLRSLKQRSIQAPSWKDPMALGKSIAWSMLVALLLLSIDPPLPLALAMEFGLASFSGSHS
jgi:uncharacterized membrane protein YbaN (DUF454 family)